MERGKLERTDETCILNGRPTSGVLTLVWRDGIDVHASDYFRYLHLRAGSKEASNLEYAKIIRAFVAFARSRGTPMERMTDAFLTLWRDWKMSQPNVSDRRVNACLERVFEFLKWLESTGRIRHVVGIYHPTESADAPVARVYPVTAVARRVTGPDRVVRTVWRTELMIEGVGSAAADRHTPVEDEIRRIHAAVLKGRHGVRDALALSWAEETGARRSELLSIDLHLIPDVERLADLLDRDEQPAVPVVRKGHQTAFMLYPTVDLLMRTREYIELERASVVDRASVRIPGYQDNGALFLSGRTGDRLTPDALTKLSTHAFAEAGVAKASLHRLRARYALNALDALLDAVFVQDDIPNLGSWTETILTKLMELMGHASVSSLTPYIQFAFQKRMKKSVAARALEAEVRLRNAELAYEGKMIELRPIKAFHRLGAALEGNRFAEARRLHNELKVELVRLAA